jgi:hypothetical protein
MNNFGHLADFFNIFSVRRLPRPISCIIFRPKAVQEVFRLAAKGLFDTEAINLVGDALSLAEDRVSDHYWLTAGSWQRYSYEVKTVAELQTGQISDTALAQVLRFRNPPMRGGIRARDFYRICLQDHNLLEHTWQQGHMDLLKPLLVYVLAHELVHVVRFYRFQHLFEANRRQRAEEEARVHGITAQILKKVPLKGLNKVINNFDKFGGDRFLSAA